MSHPHSALVKYEERQDSKSWSIENIHFLTSHQDDMRIFSFSRLQISSMTYSHPHIAPGRYEDCCFHLVCMYPEYVLNK